MDIRNLIFREGHFINTSKLNKNSIVVDAGCCWGELPNVFNYELQIWPKKIYAFEPCISCLNKLKRQKEDKPYNNVIIIEKALVGEGYPLEIEFKEVYDAKGKYAAWGNLENLHTDEEFKRREGVDEIRVYSVDTFNFNNIFDIVEEDRIDYLKMDIEGSEKGILETMKRSVVDRIDQISVEIHDNKELHYADILKSFGFENVLINIFPNIHEIYCARGE